MVVVLLLGVLLFGKRLPEVGRTLGKGIIDFKKGLRGMGDEFDSPVTTSGHASEASRSYEVAETSVPKFEPPSSAPTPRSEYEPPAASP